MNAVTRDHQLPVHRIPRMRPDWQPWLVVAVIIALVLMLAWMALKANTERQITARIYALTEQAIRTQVPACDVQTYAGIRVQNCITMVSQ